ncbi:MAG: hypothetical protein CME70_21215 [Halobacteriovorax sp.]|nr:hypothetical protein [Halobacteriovorax sp.]|tara:strand:+ start:96296 stop:96481 length:186 start_codon:yes stop_codon:yes gene_type:complete
MGVKKLERLYKEGDKLQCKKDKELVEQYQKAIADKLQDPELAKKAAMIIEQMLKEKLKSNK